MSKKSKSIIKKISNGVMGAGIGFAESPKFFFKHCLYGNLEGIIFFSLHPVTAPFFNAVLVAKIVPTIAYCSIRGAQIGACDLAGLSEVSPQLLNRKIRKKSDIVGMNFFDYYSKECQTKRNGKRELIRRTNIIIHVSDSEQDKIKKSIEVMNNLRVKDEGKKHPRSLFSLFPNELIVNVAAAQRKKLKKPKANKIAYQHLQSLSK